MSERIKYLIKVVESAEAQLIKALIEEFPLGTRVSWSHGRHRRFGTVHHHGKYSADLMVKLDSGSIIRRSAADII